jgi:hypothetical protein
VIAAKTINRLPIFTSSAPYKTIRPIAPKRQWNQLHCFTGLEEIQQQQNDQHSLPTEGVRPRQIPAENTLPGIDSIFAAHRNYGDSLLNPFFPWLSPPLAFAALGHMMGQSGDDEAGKAGHAWEHGSN